MLAAGDYANNAEMISRYKGAEFAVIEGINPYSTGDGHRLVEQAGGELLNMDVTYGPELRFVATTEKAVFAIAARQWTRRRESWACVCPWFPSGSSAK